MLLRKQDALPVARIIQRGGAVFGEVTGAPEALHQVDVCVHKHAEMLGCRLDTRQTKVGDTSTLTIEATPRQCHCIGDNPEEKILRAIFADDRRGSPGAILSFES